MVQAITLNIYPLKRQLYCLHPLSNQPQHSLNKNTTTATIIRQSKYKHHTKAGAAGKLQIESKLQVTRLQQGSRS